MSKIETTIGIDKYRLTHIKAMLMDKDKLKITEAMHKNSTRCNYKEDRLYIQTDYCVLDIRDMWDNGTKYQYNHIDIIRKYNLNPLTVAQMQDLTTHVQRLLLRDFDLLLDLQYATISEMEINANIAIDNDYGDYLYLLNYLLNLSNFAVINYDKQTLYAKNNQTLVIKYYNKAEQYYVKTGELLDYNLLRVEYTLKNKEIKRVFNDGKEVKLSEFCRYISDGFIGKYLKTRLYKDMFGRFIRHYFGQLDKVKGDLRQMFEQGQYNSGYVASLILQYNGSQVYTDKLIDLNIVVLALRAIDRNYKAKLHTIFSRVDLKNEWVLNLKKFLELFNKIDFYEMLKNTQKKELLNVKKLQKTYVTVEGIWSKLQKKNYNK